MDSAVNADNDEQLHVEETDDSCRLKITETVPCTRDTGSCDTTECLSGDWSADAKQENFAVVKQERDDVCFVSYVVLSTTDTIYVDSW